MTRVQRIIVVHATVLAVLALGNYASAAHDVNEECSLDNQDQACRDSDGLYGHCSEDGPNSCDGENPDRPGECRGYPSCQIDFEACDGKAVGDACEIADVRGEDNTAQLPGVCVTFAFDDAEPGDEFVTCDLSAADDDEEEEEGCSTAVGSTGSLGALIALGGLFLLRRRS